MRRIEKAFGGRTFALAVFLAVYAGLLAIVLMPREGATANTAGITHLLESTMIAAK
jgi:hypothetical protein